MSDLRADVLNDIGHFDGPVHRALRAVVDLHGGPSGTWFNQRGEMCRACATTLPCEESRVIAAALGIKETAS